MERPPQIDDQTWQLARQVHAAGMRVMVEQYDQAASDSLCAAGAWEVAVAALHALDLAPIIIAAIPREERG